MAQGANTLRKPTRETSLRIAKWFNHVINRGIQPGPPVAGRHIAPRKAATTISRPIAGLHHRRRRRQLDRSQEGRLFRVARRGQKRHLPGHALRRVELGRTNAGRVKQFRAQDHLTAAETRRMGRCSQMALAAAYRWRSGRAVDDRAPRPRASGRSRDDDGRTRTCSEISTTRGSPKRRGGVRRAWIPARLRRCSRFTSLAPSAPGRRAFTLPAACAAGNYAIGLATDRSARARQTSS